MLLTHRSLLVVYRAEQDDTETDDDDGEGGAGGGAKVGPHGLTRDKPLS